MTATVSEYFDWLCNQVNPNHYAYYQLFEHLFDIQYDSYFRTDENRASDGIALRYEFGESHNLSEIDIHNEFRKRPCSVFEAMVGLAKRLEEHILCNDAYGNRTPEWFYFMLESLGLNMMFDGRFDSDNVDRIIDDFLEHKYARDGAGGWFHVPNTDKDMRNLDIWYQAMEFIKRMEDNGYE